MYTIEEESGTLSGSPRKHNGYYAGDFSTTPMCAPSEITRLARLRPPTVLSPTAYAA